MILEVRRDRLVREEHELLDQPVGYVTLERDDGLDDAALVQNHLRLVQVEIDRPPAPPRVVQDLEQIAHVLEHRHQRHVLLEQRRGAVGQNAVYGRVGHPFVAVNHAVVKLGMHHATVPIDLHQARLHESVDPRVEAAEPGRQLRRKHVHGSLWKVHRRAAIVRLAVERAAFAHVMRHVGDVNAQPIVAARPLLNRDRVVEVACMLAVNRDCL